MDANRKAWLGFLGFCALMVLLGAAGLTLNFLSVERSARQHVGASAALTAAWVGATLDASDQALRDVAASVTVADLVAGAGEAGRAGRMEEILEARRKSVPHARAAALVNGNCVVAHAAGTAGFGAAVREFCLTRLVGLTEASSMSPLLVLADGQRLLLQARRVVAGDVTGWAVLGLGIDAFMSHAQRVPMQADGEVLLLDAELRVLGRNPALPGMIGQPLALREAELVLASTQVADSFAASSPLDGVARKWAFQRVPNQPIVVLIGVARSQWLAMWYQRFVVTLFVIVLLMFVARLALRLHQEKLAVRATLARISTVDELSGAATRRFFLAEAGKEVSRSRRYRGELALLRIDIDQLRRINETQGQQVGDRVISVVAQACQSCLRPFDLFGRLDGDDFAILLPNTPAGGAREVGERLRKAVQAAAILAEDGKPVRVTVSVGGIAPGMTNESIAGLMVKADAALQHAKRAGHGRLEIVDESIFAAAA